MGVIEELESELDTLRRKLETNHDPFTVGRRELTDSIHRLKDRIDLIGQIKRAVAEVLLSHDQESGNEPQS